MTSLYLNQETWDLDVDATGGIATCEGPYQLAQDAACAIKTFAGECAYDTTLGVPYLSQILGRSPAPALLKAQLEAAAMSVAGVAKAQVFITSTDNRTVQGQVQVTDANGATAVVGF